MWRIAPFWVAALLVSAAAAAPVSVSIDPSVRYQTISGWEVTLDLSDTPATPEWAGYREDLLDRAVEGVGIDRVRLEVRAGAETRSGDPARFIAGRIDYPAYKAGYYRPENDNADPHSIDWSGFDFSELDWHVEKSLLPLRKRLEARGERLFVNLLYVGFRREPYLHQQDPEEYAEFILAASLHLRERWGIVPDLWEAVLEPDNRKVNGPWSPDAMARAIAAAGRRLEAAGFAPAFSAPSVTDARNVEPYMAAIMARPEAARYMREVSYHLYYGNRDPVIARVARIAQDHGLRTAMLEWWSNRADIDVLMRDITVGNVAAWQGNALSGLFRPGAKLQLKPVNRVRRLIFRDVRAGAVRIGAEASVRDVRTAAFVNPDGRLAAFVAMRAAGGLEIAGLAPGPALLSFEATARNGGPARDREPVTIPANGRLTLSVPGPGLVSVVSR